ncbi:MAG: hypothetical protein VB106_12020, partial [Clostridiaceae bacterium]|nr:hypothetical protein [Clostridiaceae bacterium]
MITSRKPSASSGFPGREVLQISKVYIEKDVLTAARERISLIFSCFSHLYLCVSGGKDSSVMLQLCAEIAR